MKQEDKELLLKDLSGRIMYGVKCSAYEDTNAYTLSGILPNKVYNELYFEELDWKECNGFAYIQYFKPWLFPLSSMTEEQYEEFIIISGWDGDIEDIRRGKFSCLGYIGLDYIYDTIDWFNKNHFDYRGLIPMGLANDATGLNIY